MKPTLLTIFFIFTIFRITLGQEKPAGKEFYSKEFNWRIIIPEGFESVPAEQWSKMMQKGKETLEKTYDAEIENKAKAICIFKSDQFNYFESNQQPADTTEDYVEFFKGVNDLLFGAFQAQMPDAEFDSAYSSEMIDGKLFQVFKATIVLPNKMKLQYFMYSRLFGNKDLTINILTVDSEKQRLLLEAWRNSKFDVK